MRARLALVYSKTSVILREINLKNKAPEFLNLSPKGTVPVLVLTSGEVIDESLDIVNFLLPSEEGSAEIKALLDALHGSVIPALMRFKYSDRYEDVNIEDEQAKIYKYFDELESLLSKSSYLLTKKLGKADILILPFVRQIYKIDMEWFDLLPYGHVKKWLHDFLESDLHEKIMQKYSVWEPGQKIVVL